MEQDKLQKILQAQTLEEFNNLLKSSNCRRCNLSEYGKQIVTYRGNPCAKAMIIGEAPGKIEEKLGSPFVGPAGEMMDTGFNAIDMPANDHFFITNICLCRPAAVRGSGRENFTPVVEQRKQCVVFAERMMELINPKLLIAVGGVAAQTLLKLNRLESGWMTKNSGQIYQAYDRPCYVMFHPAYVLHSKAKGPEEFLRVKTLYWNQILTLKEKYKEICGD